MAKKLCVNVSLPNNVLAGNVISVIAASCGNEVKDSLNSSRLQYDGVRVRDRFDTHDYIRNSRVCGELKISVRGKYNIDFSYILEPSYSMGKKVFFESSWDDEGKKGILTPSLAIALSVRLVTFFGGGVIFDPYYHWMSDFGQKSKTNRENHPLYDKDLINMKKRILKLNPVNSEELKKARNMFNKLYKKDLKEIFDENLWKGIPL